MASQQMMDSESRLSVASATQGAIDFNAPLAQVLEQATGAEICVFSAERVQLSAACKACAAGPHGKPELGRACELVQILAAGEPFDQDQIPGLCEAGRIVRVHALENNQGNVLVLSPAAGPDEADFQRRMAATGVLWERCQRLAKETEGLAQEVIRSYEQLNVIFDITQQICKSRDAAEIKHFLIRRLAQTLNCEWSCCMSATEGMLWWSSNHALNGEELIAQVRARHAKLLWQVCEQRNALAFNRSEAESSSEPYSMLIGTLGEAEAAPDLMLLARGADQPEFIYGDLMMIDSMLSHAQHVIANLSLAERLRTMSLGAVRALVSAIDKKDRYTSGHSERVGFLSHLIGQRMGLGPEQLQDLEWAGLLHDVGKIGVREGVLSKPAGLDSDEFEHIKEHVRMSYEIVAPIECMAGVRDVVLYHHEVPDGSGYPKGLKGEEIPLLARIVHVADTFDALTTSRSYRKAFPVSKAVSIMQAEKGTKLEAEIVDCFLEAFAAFRTEQPDRFRQLFAHLEEEPS